MLFKNNDYKGHKKDEYYTPKYAVEIIEKYLKPQSKIWCPFDTEESEFVKYFTQKGHIVTYSHKNTNSNFFNEINNIKEQAFDYIISNPPFSIKNKIIDELYKINIPFALLMNINSLETETRQLNYSKGLELLIPNTRIQYLDGDTNISKNNCTFLSIYFCKGILPNKIIFCKLNKKNK